MKSQKRWKNPLLTLNSPTPICKICFKKTAICDIFSLINEDFCLCNQCRNKLKPHFHQFYILGYEATAIYDYDDEIKNLLYLLKGCGDVELSSVFLERYKRLLQIRYSDYVIVPAPSYIEDDKIRGFNHVEKIFSDLNLPIVRMMDKKQAYKQSDQKRQNREDIGNVLTVDKNKVMYGKKVLIVDDVLTTGSTIKSMVSLIKRFRPKAIKILVLSRVNNKNDFG